MYLIEKTMKHQTQIKYAYPAQNGDLEIGRFMGFYEAFYVGIQIPIGEMWQMGLKQLEVGTLLNDLMHLCRSTNLAEQRISSVTYRYYLEYVIKII